MFSSSMAQGSRNAQSTWGRKSVHVGSPDSRAIRMAHDLPGHRLDTEIPSQAQGAT